MTSERKRAAGWGLAAAGVLAALLLVGSGDLARFDPALICYTFAVLFSAFGVTYRFTMWVQRPPTAMYWKRAGQLCLRPAGLARNIGVVLGRFTKDFVFNRFIFRRGRLRGVAHWLHHVGLSDRPGGDHPPGVRLGRVQDGTGQPEPLSRLRLRHSAGRRSRSIRCSGFVVFHVLVWPSLLIVAGVFLAIRRRLRDEGAAALQRFGEDFLPLILLFAISATGLMLTSSYTWMKGHAYEFLAVLHAITVIFTLLWLPFGKLFHVFQRPAHLAVAVYKDAGRRQEQAVCRRCTEPFASLMHIQDLITVERQLGYRYETKDSATEHYQWICPRCRRRCSGWPRRGCGRRQPRIPAPEGRRSIARGVNPWPAAASRTSPRS